MNNGKISVIIPVFNSVGTVIKTVTSVLNQTYNDFEILLVDDGSDDGSAKICDVLATKNEKVTAIHESNQGVSHARNEGIKASSGKYIVFIDSDDTIEQDYFEKLLLSMTQEDIKLVDMTDSISSVMPLAGFYYVEYAILNGDTHVWGKLFDASLIKDNNIFFPEGLSIGEDMLFLLDVAVIIGREHLIRCINQNGYNYFDNADGAMRAAFKPSYMDQINCWRIAEERLCGSAEELSTFCFVKLAIIQIMASMLVVGKIACASANNDESSIEDKNHFKYLNECRQMVMHARKRNGAFAGLSYVYKLKVMIFMLNSGLYLKLYRHWKEN